MKSRLLSVLVLAVTLTPAPGSGREIATDPLVQSENMTIVANVPGANANFAFWGEIAVVTNMINSGANSGDGFTLLDVSDPTNPHPIGRFDCPGAWYDVSIWKHLVFLSTQAYTVGPECGASLTTPDDPQAFSGIRVVSIADPSEPRPVAAVATGVHHAVPGRRTVYGSHTHTPVPDLSHRDSHGRPDPRILIYSADGTVGPGIDPWASIIEVPLKDPSNARVLKTFETGTHAPCHDITVSIPRNLLVCAAIDAGVTIFDVKNREQPELVSHFDNPFVEIQHHSTSFSNDGRTLVLSDERATAFYGHTCLGGTGAPLGALWFYDITDPRAPRVRGFFQLPRPNAEHMCYGHEHNVVPMNGNTDVLVAGWYGGGTSLVDFTDPSKPREIAYWVRSGLDGGHSMTVAAHWYNGYVYAANQRIPLHDEPPTGRGFDVFRVDHPAMRSALRLARLNPQTQESLEKGVAGSR